MICLETKTYLATLYSPLFYSSSEGVIISADKILGSTALTYALGYNLGILKKRYFLQKDESINHNYKELKELDLFVSDGRPLNVNYTEETFKSTEYLSERSITVTVPAGAKGNMGRFKKTDPKLMGSDSPAIINKVRRYVGLAPQSTFEVTVWSRSPLPDSIFLTLGIHRSGELRLKCTKPAEKVYLNAYMLKEVYGFSEDPVDKNKTSLLDIYKASNNFIRGSDYRKQHFLDVNVRFVNEKIVPFIFREIE